MLLPIPSHQILVGLHRSFNTDSDYIADRIKILAAATDGVE